jgi:hypothetical protein
VHSTGLVVITNGTGLLQQEVFSLLKTAAFNPLLKIWLKLDAGTPGWYQKMNRSSIPHEELIAKIKEFAACAPVTIQTMLCRIGEAPSEAEAKAWETLVCELAANNKKVDETGVYCGIKKVQMYGKARSAPEDPLASELPAQYLETRAASLRSLFSEKGLSIPVKVYL